MVLRPLAGLKYIRQRFAEQANQENRQKIKQHLKSKSMNIIHYLPQLTLIVFCGACLIMIVLPIVKPYNKVKK